jgi:hypothetical protein
MGAESRSAIWNKTIEWRRTGDEGIEHAGDIGPRRGGGEGIVGRQKIGHEWRLKLKIRLNKESGVDKTVTKNKKQCNGSIYGPEIPRYKAVHILHCADAICSTLVTIDVLHWSGLPVAAVR